ncbi:alpha/beta hydrolase [Novosphingobium sp. CECT 9465]|jgi:alpha-beta hydrolase superfamily lysophospholipase|uniref:alpha/beta hydrolase n=1 Tax=Novosphingobium sp. CECT 9465 TaxID=2829794 RepID=UPI001E567BDC|nr:alpha/beta fold hydrolase [Novosphingobium sp. CECT 9465]CAH0498804.1 hypothetical protein NVSP9465_03898 [Novosphingobium sp. CECT 9465]
MPKSTLFLACAMMLASPALGGEPAETPIAAPGPDAPLSGTLRSAAGPQRAMALIIPGSGPTDRDGNNPLIGNAATYRLLAEALADKGIASVRIDKRGMFGSRAAVADPNAVTIPDYVADIAAWVSTIRAQTGAPCVWLIGHSEGGLVALASAGAVDDLCGLVLLSAGGRPFGEVIRQQLRANPANAPLLAAGERAIDELTAGRRVAADALPGPLLQVFHPAVQGYLISAMARDPASLATDTALPMLIVQGGKDIQVPTGDGERLKAAQPRATLLVVPGMNHVLKDVAGDSMADNIAVYRATDLPLSAGVAAAIASFMLSGK